MNSADLTALFKKHPVGFGCLLLSIVCGVLINLRYGNISASQSEFQATSAEAEIVLANVRNSADLEEHIAEIQVLGKDLESRLMKAGQLAVNLQYFYKLEAENEVKLVDVRQNLTTRNPKTQFVGVPFVVSVQGTYQNVMNFLNKLQNGRHFCRINTASFRKAGTAAAEMSLTLNLELLGQP